MLILLTLLGCPGTPTDTGKPIVEDTAGDLVDADGDGVPEGADCDDNDEYTYPGADEVPYDGEDQDCDGEDVNDVDGDGYVGDGAGGDDCNDANPDVHPGAETICYDLIDESCTGVWSQYDCDGDGYDVTEDCGDEDTAVYPGAPDEWYDGVDSDCDNRDDYDQDEDGYQSDAYVVDTTSGEYGDDCDDLDAAINVDADEIWDTRDNDCGGTTDVLTNRTTSSAWYGDGYLGESYFGWDFAPVGDLDGDGFTDVVVGVLGYSKFVGSAYVLSYGEGLQVPADDALASITGTSYFGAAVTGVAGPSGDLVAIGEPGMASVQLFDTADLTGGAALTTSDVSGVITSGTYYIGGDLAAWDDGAGGQSLLVSTFEVEEAGTFVGLFPGSALTGSLSEANASWTWEASGDTYDAAVLSDFDGDGLDEIGVGTSGFGGSTRAYVMTGALVAEGGADTSTSAVSGFTGHVLLQGAPDLDGDGYGEYLVSDIEADGSGTGAGVVWVIGGPEALEGGAAEDIAFATIAGVTDDGALRAGSSTGDLDADGVVDVIVCAPGDGASSIKGGCNWVSATDLAGGGEHAPGSAGPTFSSVAYDDEYGADAFIGDADGDGDDDVWISSIGDAGSLFLYLQE